MTKKFIGLTAPERISSTRVMFLKRRISSTIGKDRRELIEGIEGSNLEAISTFIWELWGCLF
jgi:hypothetical protein